MAAAAGLALVVSGPAWAGRSGERNGSYKDCGIDEVGLISGRKSNDNPFRPVPRRTDPAGYQIGPGSWDELDIEQMYWRGTREGVYGELMRTPL